MRSKTLVNTALFGLVTSILAVAACSEDQGKNDAPPPAIASTVTPAETQEVSVPQPEPVAVPVDPVAAKAAWKDGVALFADGNFTAAAEQLKIAVAGRPHDSYRHYLLGLSLWKSGDLPAAEASLLESVTIDNTRVKGWINLARVRNARGDRDGAVGASDSALALEPGSADAMHQKGRALMEQNRGEAALSVLTEAHELDGTNGYIANTLGLLLIQLGRPADAVSPLEAAKAALPHVAFVRNNLGVAYERVGRLDEAKIEYLAAVEAGDTGGKAMSSLTRLGATDTTGQEEPPVTTASANSQ